MGHLETQKEDEAENLSSLEMLICQVVDALQACFLGVCQNHRPNGIAHMPQAIGHAESKTVNRVGVHLQGHISEWCSWLKPLVELNPVLHPAVVKALWGLIEDQLEHGPAGSDLEEP